MNEAELERIGRRKAGHPASLTQEGEAVMPYTITMVRLSPAIPRDPLAPHAHGRPTGNGPPSAAPENDCDRWRASALGCGASLVEPLTAREVEVLELLLDGAGNREIATGLVISPRTVETHLTNIYGKLGVRGRSEAILWTMQQALLERQPAGQARGAFLQTCTLVVYQPSGQRREENERSALKAWSTW